MILKIVQSGDDILRSRANKVSAAKLKDPATQQLVDLMIATLRDRPGVGLAAPQVGKPVRIIVIEDKKQYHERVSESLLKAQSRKPVSLKVIVNPVITIDDTAEQKLFFEGCLSVEGYAAIVPRADKLHVSGLDRSGKEISFTAKGWLARIIQHEVGHLDGELYVDTMLSRTFITDKEYANKWQKSNPAELAGYIRKSQYEKEPKYIDSFHLH